MQEKLERFHRSDLTLGLPVLVSHHFELWSHAFFVGLSWPEVLSVSGFTQLQSNGM
jgi:hypothetical protein